MKRFELRDPIHKRITFDEFERSVIDHPFFQRLRFIKQLSFLITYVYPGGMHDRFSHSIGAFHIAKRLFNRLVSSSSELRERLSKEEIDALGKRVRFAGLLHDIGHGPFSHASELVFPPLKDLPLNWNWWKEKPDRQSKHEDYSVLLIQTLAAEGLFENDFAQDICSLIHGSVAPSNWFSALEEKAPTLQPVLKALISGEVDCDRMDYLLRDSYYCGVAYGQYDLDWLISSMGLAVKDSALVFKISENGVRAFEDLLLARYHMIDQVYFHKTKAGFTHYLEQVIQTKEIDIQIPTDPYAYADLRDGKVIELMFEAAKDERNYWSHHLIRRIPPKRILRLQRTNLEDMATFDKLKGICEKNDIRYFTHEAAGELSHFGEGSDANELIYVAKKVLGGIEHVPISQYSDLLQKYNEKLNFIDFFVFREDFEKFQSVL
jgi:uncharacterized protein